MKPTITKPVRIVFFILLFLIFLREVIAYSFNKNDMNAFIWYERIMNGSTFHIQNTKIKIPKHCAMFDSEKSNQRGIYFWCATSPTEVSIITIYKTQHEITIDNLKKNPSIKSFTDHGDYILLTMESLKSTLYYLKRQNIIITSDSPAVAKEFIDLLSRYDFQVDNETH
jgi:hypothetical protein